ncbi:hypothetical protein JZ751_019577, partial [Albula glossodonta]
AYAQTLGRLIPHCSQKLVKLEIISLIIKTAPPRSLSCPSTGEKGTLSHGAVVDGKFEGFIQTRQGTYYVEPTERYLKDQDTSFHSVIYHEDDIALGLPPGLLTQSHDPKPQHKLVTVASCDITVDFSALGTELHREYPHKYGAEGGCADHSVFERMKKYQMSAVEEPAKETNHVVVEEEQSDGPVLLRKRRAAQVEKNTCQLFIQTDHLFYKYYGTREAVIAQISSHVKAIDSIYQSTDFLGIRNISFMVKRIRINTTTDEKDRTNPFRFANIGVEKFLELNSEQNHDDYCLAYVFTDRDFDDGVLGLAWVGAPAVGHNFGSPHDSGTDCTPGESKSQDLKEKGNYIMYARATSGDKLNNNKFSICSVRNISQVLEKKRGYCFVESGQPICGNGLVEAGEECDCGYSDQCKDQCCYDANQADGTKCKLKPGKVCRQVGSRPCICPSQGPCCTQDCSYKSNMDKCREESECAHQGMCNGSTAQCPTSEPKANFTACHGETQVCLNGGCSGSICEKYGLEVCTCASVDGKDETELCHVCCQEKMKPNTCSSTGSDKWSRFFNKKTTTLQPGSPCNDFKGYCDVFMKCRLVDADGPLARLKKAIFNPELYENIAEWIVASVSEKLKSSKPTHNEYPSQLLMHTEEEETPAHEPAAPAAAPPPPPPASRELSDGPDETLRPAALCLGSS